VVSAVHGPRVDVSTDSDTNVRSARVAIGVVVGLVAAFALTRLMSSLLFGIGPLDAPTYLAALGVLLAAAAFASYVPARRAASIDPVETLKTE
jgi:putative ABC transport system permease protein